KIGSPTASPVMFSYIMNFSITSCFSVKRKDGQNRKNAIRPLKKGKDRWYSEIILALWFKAMGLFVANHKNYIKTKKTNKFSF
ncbi:MAG: hypothetical protein IJW25_02720, partial [Clostridia bacterium]|nr:hypothetical protein [Clostridia bacterium]